MKTGFTKEIAGFVYYNLPPTLWLWQVRGIVLEVEEITRPTSNPEKQNPGGRLRDLHLKIGDLDNPEDGYDVRIEGVFHQVQPFDVVSLLGHEHVNASEISTPRLFINHNTGAFTRAYPIEKHLMYGVVPIIEYKYWLSHRIPLKPWARFLNFWKMLLWLGLPFVLLAGPHAPILLGGIALLALWGLLPIVLASKYFDWVFDQPRFSFEKKKVPSMLRVNYRTYVDFFHQDLTPFYEKVARRLHQDALDNPAPEIDFVPVARGRWTIGKIESPMQEQEFFVKRQEDQIGFADFQKKSRWAENEFTGGVRKFLNALARLRIVVLRKAERTKEPKPLGTMIKEGFAWLVAKICAALGMTTGR